MSKFLIMRSKNGWGVYTIINGVHVKILDVGTKSKAKAFYSQLKAVA